MTCEACKNNDSLSHIGKVPLDPTEHPQACFRNKHGEGYNLVLCLDIGPTEQKT